MSNRSIQFDSLIFCTATKELSRCNFLTFLFLIWCLWRGVYQFINKARPIYSAFFGYAQSKPTEQLSSFQDSDATFASPLSLPYYLKFRFLSLFSKSKDQSCVEESIWLELILLENVDYVPKYKIIPQLLVSFYIFFLFRPNLAFRYLRLFVWLHIFLTWKIFLVNNNLYHTQGSH